MLLLPPSRRIRGTLYDGSRYRPCFIPRAYSVKLVIVAPCPLWILGLKTWRLALSSRPKGRPHAVHTYSSRRISYVVLRLPFTLLTPVLLLSSWLRDTASHSFRVFIISIMYMALQAYNSCKQYTRFCDFSIYREHISIHRTTECTKHLKILQSCMVDRSGDLHIFKAESQRHAPVYMQVCAR